MKRSVFLVCGHSCSAEPVSDAEAFSFAWTAFSNPQVIFFSFFFKRNICSSAAWLTAVQTGAKYTASEAKMFKLFKGRNLQKE